MNDHRVHTDLPQQNDIARKAFHGLIAAHSVTTKFDHYNRIIIALQVGQCFAEGAGGGDPIAFHGVLLFHVGVLLALVRTWERDACQGKIR